MSESCSHSCKSVYFASNNNKCASSTPINIYSKHQQKKRAKTPLTAYKYPLNKTRARPNFYSPKTISSSEWKIIESSSASPARAFIGNIDSSRTSRVRDSAQSSPYLNKPSSSCSATRIKKSTLSSHPCLGWAKIESATPTRKIDTRTLVLDYIFFSPSLFFLVVCKAAAAVSPVFSRSPCVCYAWILLTSHLCHNLANGRADLVLCARFSFTIYLAPKLIVI